jgi:hypothetical protein
MTHGLGFEEAFLSFRSFHELFQSYAEGVSVENVLRAFCCAKCLNWIDFKAASDAENKPSKSINIPEFIHYSR